MRKIAVVAHDAGGANILVSLVLKYYDAFDWRFIVAGPAARIFSAHPLLQKKIMVDRTTECLLGELLPDIMITGTGWETDHEILGIRFAKENGIPVVSYLDHWTNYRDRFGSATGWLANLPDYIAVGDMYAFERASLDGFPVTKLLPLENPYLENFLLPVSSTCRVPSNRLLFLSEPFDADFVPSGVEYSNKWVGIECSILGKILRAVFGAPALSGYTLAIRLHPSEAFDKYDDFKVRGEGRIEIHDAFSRSLVDDCCAADCVIGISSMALLVSASLSRKTISFSPQGMDGGLPHSEIVRCHDEQALVTHLLDMSPASQVDLKLFRNAFDTKINTLLSQPHA